MLPPEAVRTRCSELTGTIGYTRANHVQAFTTKRHTCCWCHYIDEIAAIATIAIIFSLCYLATPGALGRNTLNTHVNMLYVQVQATLDEYV